MHFCNNTDRSSLPCVCYGHILYKYMRVHKKNRVYSSLAWSFLWCLLKCITPDYSSDVISLRTTKMVFERIQIDETKSEKDWKKNAWRHQNDEDVCIESRFGTVRWGKQAAQWSLCSMLWLKLKLRFEHTQAKHQQQTIYSRTFTFCVFFLVCALRFKMCKQASSQNRNENINEHINNKK